MNDCLDGDSDAIGWELDVWGDGTVVLAGIRVGLNEGNNDGDSNILGL